MATDTAPATCTCQGLGCDTCCPPPELPIGPFLWESATWDGGDSDNGFDWEAEAAAELRAEFAMNWVMGGGHQHDIGAAFYQHHGRAY